MKNDWTYEETGGGCSAYVKHSKNGQRYMLVTIEDDCTAPHKGQRATIGWYCHEHSEPLVERNIIWPY